MPVPAYLAKITPKPLGYQCPKCGVGTLNYYGTESTCVGYISPPGHNHDDNCRGHAVYCSEGCDCTFHIRNRCSDLTCEWVGKAACGAGCRHEKLEVNPYPQASESPYHWVDGGRRLASKLP